MGNSQRYKIESRYFIGQVIDNGSPTSKKTASQQVSITQAGHVP